MTLLELCEPLFQHVCRLSRSARKGEPMNMEHTRSELHTIFSNMRSRAAAAPELAGQFERIELPLMFFVDFMIRNSRLPFAAEWEGLAAERDEMAGEDRFWDMLEDELNHASDAHANDRLAVYYTCIGLGFTGRHEGQPEYLRQKMQQLAGRLGDRIDSDASSKICPEAYEHTDTRDLIEPPGPNLVGMLIVLVGLSVVVLIANIYAFHVSTQEMEQALHRIVEQREPTSAAPAAPAGRAVGLVRGESR